MNDGGIRGVTVRVAAGPPARARARLGYVPALDGLRGVAVLLVIGNHAPLRQYASLLPGGFAGVDIFFVLSGFLITTLLVQEFARAGAISLRRFYVRRVLRLGPALIALLVVLCGLSFILFDKAQAEQNCVNALISLFYISNWVRVFSHNQLGLLAHTWSLSTEEQFYLIWPIILWMSLRASLGKGYVVAVAVAMALLSWGAAIYLTLKGATFFRVCFGLDSRLDTLMIGCILGVVLCSGMMTETVARRMRKFLTVVSPLSLAGLIAFSISGNPFGKGLFYFGLVLIALLAAFVILDVMINPRSLVKGFLAMKWLVWIGSISYGLYLWHWPIFYAMFYKFHLKGWTVVMAGTPLTFVMVLLSYYFLERPMLGLKKRFAVDGGLKSKTNQAKV